jgi:hypothetical protein
MPFNEKPSFFEPGRCLYTNTLYQICQIYASKGRELVLLNEPLGQEPNPACFWLFEVADTLAA